MAAFQQQILALPISLLMWYPEQQQSPSLTKEGVYYNLAALWMQQYALSGFTSTPIPFSWKTPIRCKASAFNGSASRICLRYSCIFTSIFPQTATQLLSMHLMNSNLHWQSSNSAPSIYNDRAFSKFFLTPKPFSQHLPQFRNAFPHLSSVARFRYLIPRQRLEPLTVQDSLSPMRTYMAPRLFNALGNSYFLAMEQYLTACWRFGSMMQSYSWVPETSLWETAEWSPLDYYLLMPFQQIWPRSVMASRWPFSAAFSQCYIASLISSLRVAYPSSKSYTGFTIRFSRNLAILYMPSASQTEADLIQYSQALLRSLLTYLPSSQRHPRILQIKGFIFSSVQDFIDYLAYD